MNRRTFLTRVAGALAVAPLVPKAITTAGEAPLDLSSGRIVASGSYDMGRMFRAAEPVFAGDIVCLTNENRIRRITPKDRSIGIVLTGSKPGGHACVVTTFS